MDRMTQFPIGAAVTVERMRRDPYPVFAALQSAEPISWLPAFKMWMVTRRADVIDLLRDAELFTMEPPAGQINPMQDTFGPMMLSLDGPRHKRVRDVFIEPYRPRHARRFYSDLIVNIVNQLIDEIEQRDTIDLDKAFSDKLAVYTVIATLGFAVDDIGQFRDWYDEFGVAIGNVAFDPAIRARGQRAMQAFRTLLLVEIERVRRAPNASVLSQIIHNANSQLTLDDIVSNVALTFFGGVETTSAMLSNILWSLLTHPEQMVRVRDDDNLLQNGIEEALRWEAPVQGAMRFPTRDVEFLGVSIRQGEKIYGMLGAANRDATMFERPELFDVTRPNADKHLSFAYGPHFCFGAPLARMEAQIGLSLLLKRLPNMSLDASRPTAPVGHEFRSPPTLHVLTHLNRRNTSTF